MAGHHTGWIKLRGATKGRVFVSRAAMAEAGLSPAQVRKLPNAQILLLAGQGPSGTPTPKVTPTPGKNLPPAVKLLSPGIRQAAQQELVQGGGFQAARRTFRTTAKQAAFGLDLAKAPLAAMQQALNGLPPPVRKALVVAAGATLIGAAATGAAPPALAVAVVAAAGSVALDAQQQQKKKKGEG